MDVLKKKILTDLAETFEWYIVSLILHQKQSIIDTLKVHHFSIAV